MENIKASLTKLYDEIPPGVELVAVSKFHPVEAIKEAYDAGQRRFGESRVQEFLEKQKHLPDDIEWHFIGHLQTNKVRQIIGKTYLIESVDTERLLNLIDAESAKAGVMTNVLLQLHVAREETKFGFSEEELLEFLKSGRYKALNHTVIRGVMGMASNTDDMSLVADDFRRIYSMYDKIRNDSSLCLPDFNIVSMGMSGDWKIAVKEGSNLIRIGSAIFGERQYTNPQ